MDGDDILNFEEQNWSWLIEKFLNDKKINELWADFVIDEYEKTSPDIDREE